MIYLNGQIGAVYLGGHYHSEVYLGSVLVWQNVKKIPGEVCAHLAFANTADGVVAVLVPGEATEELAIAANVIAEAHGTTNGSSDELLTLLTAAEPMIVEVSDSEAFENLFDSLFEDTAWDISSDISTMKVMLRQEGLTKNTDFK